jgi:hypothetical protein
MTRTWTKIAKPTLATSNISAGNPIGLLLALTYATASGGSGTSWTKLTKASGTSWTKLTKASGTSWTKLTKAI